MTLALGSAATDPPAPAPSGRMLEPAEWSAAGIPLLRNPREVVTALFDRHSPAPATAVVAVLDPDERLAASASFARRDFSRTDLAGARVPDGWPFRNALLRHLRRVIPHDLRRRTPVRTAVLLYCREGGPGWTEEDGAWMWGLRDACTLHGLRCGAYITLTRKGWQVLGEDRGGRRPYADPPAGTDGQSDPAAAEADGPQAPAARRTGGGTPEARRRTAAR
ncbi:hypothetical protein G5C51_31120 [Streptomyces sp. A7024]|uniref:Uncharacterized protein n=1 Tax=Streptomyces coryli TaxID=1128680 RepID=A0A6G4UAC9_9ACTN|nr:hypothetical protein [Streptomyces coryli]NGN68338.1 hypothetical protein [Streptomyces coryli]